MERRDTLALAVQDDAPLLHEVAPQLAQLLALLDSAAIDEETGEVAAPVDLLSRVADLQLDLREAVEAVLGRVRARMAWAEALDKERARITDLLTTRANRLRKRAERDAEMVRQAMIATGTKKLATNTEEPSLRNGSTRVDVTDEKAVPVGYRREPPPPPPPAKPEDWPIDKTAVGDDLRTLAPKVPKGEIAPAGVVKATEGVIPGVRLVRGEPTLELD